MVALLHCRCHFDYNLLTFHCWQMASCLIFHMQVPSANDGNSGDSVDSDSPRKLQLQYSDYLEKQRHGYANYIIWICYENMQLLMSCICLFVSFSGFIHLQPLVHWLILNFIKIRKAISLRLPGKFTSANGSKCSFLVVNSQSFFCLIFLGSLDVIYYLVAVLFPYCLTQTRLACNFSECDLRNSKQLLVLWKMFYISTKERTTCGGIFWIKLDFSGYSRWNLRSPFFSQYFLVR